MFFGKVFKILGFSGIFGVPVIKEEKAIALRTSDIMFVVVLCAMQWSQVTCVNSPEIAVHQGSENKGFWAVKRVKNGLFSLVFASIQGSLL